MNLLFTMPPWGWYAIILGVALILIVIIIAVTFAQVKKNKKNKSAANADETAVSDAASAQSIVKEERKPEKEPTAAAKPKAEEKPKAQKEDASEKENKVYHIAKRKDDGKWQIKAEGGARAIKLFNTQEEAIAYAKRLADNQEARIMIHKTDGSFRKLTY